MQRVFPADLVRTFPLGMKVNQVAAEMTNFDEQRDPLELLFTEYLNRKREGDSIQIEDFALEYPDQAQEICDLFPTLEALEKVRSENGQPHLMASREELTGGLHLGEFRLLREIGAGGMGIVYEALQESINRRVAVKVLPQEFTQQTVRRTRFLQEARTVARLSFRNIVPIFDFGESENRYYFAMRLIEGAGLDWVLLRMSEDDRPLTSTEVMEHFKDQGIPLSEQQEMEEDESLACEFQFSDSSQTEKNPKHKWILRRDSWKQMARIGLQAARALGHAHQAGILHRDIKPGNLLLDGEGVIWITDFGLAKSENELSMTGTDDVVGTLRYISPERFHGKVDARSDIYALGLTLIELCIHRSVFAEVGRSEMIRNIMEGNIVPPREMNPKIPEPLEKILLKATATDPDQRYQTAAEMAEDLRAFSRGNQVQSSLTVSHRKWPGLVRKYWIALILTVLCLFQAGLLFRNNQGFEQVRVDRDQVLVRLDALDSLYQELTHREISSDLTRSLTMKSVPKNSPQWTTLNHLLPLYSQLEKDARRHRLPKVQQEISERNRLLNRLLQSFQ